MEGSGAAPVPDVSAAVTCTVVTCAVVTCTFMQGITIQKTHPSHGFTHVLCTTLKSQSFPFPPSPFQPTTPDPMGK